jgi:hypothetical protein
MNALVIGLSVAGTFMNGLSLWLIKEKFFYSDSCVQNWVRSFIIDEAFGYQ